MTVLFAKRLVRAGEERRFHIHYKPGTGWEAAEGAGRATLQAARYTDWHRVERVLRRFSLEIAELHRQGWREAESAG
jgi:hypothetical protein